MLAITLSPTVTAVGRRQRRQRREANIPKAVNHPRIRLLRGHDPGTTADAKMKQTKFKYQKCK